MKGLFWKAVEFLRPQWRVRNPTWREYVLLVLAYGSIAFLVAVVFGYLR